MVLVGKLVAVVLAATVSGAVAVPLGIFTNVHPILVLAVAAGTAIGVAWALVLGGHRFRSGIVARIGASERASSGTQRVVDRFGAVGLGLVGPVFPGVVASSLSGVAIGVDGRRLGMWLTVGIVLWFSVFTAAWWSVKAGLLR